MPDLERKGEETFKVGSYSDRGERESFLLKESIFCLEAGWDPRKDLDNRKTCRVDEYDTVM